MTLFFRSVVTYFCLILLSLVVVVNFFNTGCLLYPVKILCFESFSWAIPINEVEQMNIWYQQWSKAGADPHMRVENPELYVQNFNWVNNWFNKYFFNKVSDFLAGLVFLSLVVLTVFYSKKIKKSEKPKYLPVYAILIFLTLVWFYLTPTLRYGGYHLLALIIFVPFSIFLTRYLIDLKLLKKKVYFLILLTIFIFLSRNVIRLNFEYDAYNYNLFSNAYYISSSQNFSIFKNIKNINECYIKNNFATCSNSHIKVKFLNNSYIYYRTNK